MIARLRPTLLALLWATMDNQTLTGIWWIVAAIVVCVGMWWWMQRRRQLAWEGRRRIGFHVPPESPSDSSDPSQHSTTCAGMN